MLETKEIMYSLINEIEDKTQFELVVSVATYIKRMMKNDIYLCMDRLLNQQCQVKYHVVMNIWKDDFQKAPQKFIDYVECHPSLEVVLHEKNRRTFNKICLVKDIYKGLPILTFDDDMLYRKDAVQGMWNSHIKYPNTIIGGVGRLIERIKNGLSWQDKSQTILAPGTHQDQCKLLDDASHKITFRCYGSEGILFPSSFLQMIGLRDFDRYIETMKPPAKWSDDYCIYSLGRKFNFKWMVAEQICETWNSTVEKHLSTSKDETSHTWIHD